MKDYMDKMNPPKTLIFEHPPINKNGIGKTLYSFFYEWEKESLGQVYTVNLPIDDDLCQYYYFDGTNRGIDISQKERETNEKKRKSFAFRILSSLSHTHLGTILRNYQYKKRIKKESNLIKWIEKFKPECIFYGIGEIVEETKFINKFAHDKNIPLVLYISDDYLSKWKTVKFHPFYKKRVIQSFESAISYASSIVVISEKMKELYSELFPKKNYFIASNAAEKKDISDNLQNDSRIELCYTGNLGLSRWKTLSFLAKAIKKHNERSGKKFYLTICSQEKPSSGILKRITNEYSSYKWNLIGYELDSIRSNSQILVFAESFEKKYKSILYTALSTKISEYLSFGKLIIAIGPSYAWSVQYLNKNSAALCCFSKQDIDETIDFIDAYYGKDELLKYSLNAVSLYTKNHVFETNAEQFYMHVRSLVNDERKR